MVGARAGRVGIVAVLVSGLIGTGCAGLGHKTVRHARFGYNEAMVRSWNEQMLLNLVRLRYRDTPLFLEISSVTAQYSFGGSASASGTFQVDGDEGNEFGAGLGVAYSESPTIAYAPLQGDRFVTQLLSPVPLDALLMLTRSGWSIERVLRTCVQQANDVYNAPGASGPTPHYVPEFREFLELGRALRELQLAQALVVERGVDADGRPATGLRIRADRAPAGAQNRVAALLGLDPARDEFAVTSQVMRHDERSIDLVSRSLLGVLYYLSQAVEVPERHIEAGVTNVARYPDGRPFDWTELTGDLFRVESGAARPADAFVAVRYRDAWYWIADDDLESKTTFGLVSQLFNLQAGQVQLPAPTLTLSVN